jgi:hypothetical protein
MSDAEQSLGRHLTGEILSLMMWLHPPEPSRLPQIGRVTYLNQLAAQIVLPFVPSTAIRPNSWVECGGRRTPAATEWATDKECRSEIGAILQFKQGGKLLCNPTLQNLIRRYHSERIRLCHHSDRIHLHLRHLRSEKTDQQGVQRLFAKKGESSKPPSVFQSRRGEVAALRSGE